MYQYPVLFPTISRRESWIHIIQIVDDQTGDTITLTDASGNPLYSIFCEISPPEDGGFGGGFRDGYPSSNGGFAGGVGEPIIFASLADFITIPDIGTIQIQIPPSVMQKLKGTRTYNVYIRIVDEPNDDARQILIGKLPVAFGGRIGFASSSRGTIP
jgi:hypothetical protein